jgi:hypothetical protein
MLSQVDVELEPLALVVMQRFLHQRLNLGVERSYVRLGLEVPDDLHVGDRALPTGLGEERNVIPASLIPAGAAQVQHRHGAFVTALRFRQVAAGSADGGLRNLEPFLTLIGDDDRFHPRIARHA